MCLTKCVADSCGVIKKDFIAPIFFIQDAIPADLHVLVKSFALANLCLPVIKKMKGNVMGRYETTSFIHMYCEGGNPVFFPMSTYRW